MTWEFFETQMQRLRGLRFVPADMTTHWEALSELPESALEAAVSRAQRTRVDFPTPVELRQDADQAAPMQAEPEPDRSGALSEPRAIVVGNDASDVHLTLPVTRTWTYYCDVCGDSGWRGLWCGGDPKPKSWLEHRTCGRRDSRHLPHEWVEPCPCAEWNPAIKRRKEAEGKYAAKAGKASA